MCTNININKGSTYLRLVALRRKLLSPRDLRGFAEESHRVPQRTQILAASIGRNRELSKLLESACFACFALDSAYFEQKFRKCPTCSSRDRINRTKIDPVSLLETPAPPLRSFVIIKPHSLITGRYLSLTIADRKTDAPASCRVKAIKCLLTPHLSSRNRRRRRLRRLD